MRRLRHPRGDGPDLERLSALVVAGPPFAASPAFGYGGELNPARIDALDPWMGWSARRLFWRCSSPRTAEPLIYSGPRMAPLAICAMWGEPPSPALRGAA